MNSIKKCNKTSKNKLNYKIILIFYPNPEACVHLATDVCAFCLTFD